MGSAGGNALLVWGRALLLYCRCLATDASTAIGSAPAAPGEPVGILDSDRSGESAGAAAHARSARRPAPTPVRAVRGESTWSVGRQRADSRRAGPTAAGRGARGGVVQREPRWIGGGAKGPTQRLLSRESGSKVARPQDSLGLVGGRRWSTARFPGVQQAKEVP